MQILPVIIPYCRTKSNLALSCKDVYNWMSNNGFPISTSKKDLCFLNFDYYLSLSFPKDEICELAARSGDLELLKRARENDCKWDRWTCASAADEGHLDILRWARENGCEWDWWTLACAGQRRHLEVLRWAGENGCPSI